MKYYQTEQSRNICSCNKKSEIDNIQTSVSVSMMNHNSQSNYFIWVNNTQTDELWFIMTDNDSQSDWFVEADNTQTTKSVSMIDHNSQSD